NEIITNSVPIETDGKRIGTLTIIQKVSAIQQAEQRIRLLNAKKGFTAKTDFSEIIGGSTLIRDEINKAKMYAKSKSNILIYGETGTGKELFAQSIHNFGFQQNGPFVAVNCAALPENLLESELFGYEEGAFTGSRKGGKAGLFEIAHQGTIFLDEIGGISRNLQARLLRVLQEKEVMKIGGEKIIPIDVRIISATNEIIEDKIPHDFRDDLYYRLNVLQISIPPLRDRDNDLIDMFIYLTGQHLGIDSYKSKLTEDQVAILKYYSWPGNVRELKNVVERFSIHYKNIERYDEPVIHELLLRAIGEERLFYDILKQHGILPKDVKNSVISKELLQRLLLAFSGRKSKIAEMLGMSRTTFWRKMKDLGV
ncbi:MAG: sigma 54-interacting transcriptional regulator, partial [Bacillota bacterium]|nr:sigma 54-interacting transcriptional regulator [Bacillota bacterium]